MIDEAEVLQRYKHVEVVTDKRGRAITVGRIKLSQQSRLYEMVDKPLNRMIYNIAASVRSVDDKMLSFPRNRGEVESVLDMLDQEGFEAASEGYRKLNPDNDEPDEGDAG